MEFAGKTETRLRITDIHIYLTLAGIALYARFV